jgi:UDP-glucuronate decarboxylase
MRVLVTGGAGFLGSHICHKLIGDGHEVIALDNFYTGNKLNLIELIGNSRFEIIRHDVTKPISIETDFIFNMACPASPVHYQKFPVETTRTSVLGAINMLDLAEKLGVPILQTSTSEVYGDPTVSPQAESYWGNVNPIGIRSCYDEGKRVAETLFFDYERQYGTKIRIARIFNTYGPKMNLNDGRVVSNFIVQALQNSPITIYGEGSQTRSFCYVDDLIEGLISLAFNKKEFTGPVNLGNPVEFTMLELANLIIRLTNSSSKLEFYDLPSDDPLQRKPDIQLAEAKLGWKPNIDLEQGLRKTIEDFDLRLRQVLSE